jgi:hypothetical protein
MKKRYLLIGILVVTAALLISAFSLVSSRTNGSLAGKSTSPVTVAQQYQYAVAYPAPVTLPGVAQGERDKFGGSQLSAPPAGQPFIDKGERDDLSGLQLSVVPAGQPFIDKGERDDLSGLQLSAPPVGQPFIDKGERDLIP